MLFNPRKKLVKLILPLLHGDLGIWSKIIFLTTSTAIKATTAAAVTAATATAAALATIAAAAAATIAFFFKKKFLNQP